MKYCKLLHEITNHDLLSPEDNTDGEVVITYGQLEQDCLGAWCPHRRIPGLILIHAWNPNDMNTLTSVCVFLILSHMLLLPSSSSSIFAGSREVPFCTSSS